MLDYSEDEDGILMEHYPVLKGRVKELLPGRSIRSIHHRAHRLGLSRTRTEGRDREVYEPGVWSSQELARMNAAFAKAMLANPTERPR